MIPRIYHSETLAVGMSVTLSSSAAIHIGKSLRLTENDELRLFNGDGFDYCGCLVQADRRKTVVRISDRMHPATESPLPVTLLQGICRGARMDMLIQKSTELGIHRIVPVNCQRSIARTGAERATKKIAHWRNIAISACEQCGRARIPEIGSPTKLHDATAEQAPDATKLLLDPAGQRSIEAALHPEKPVTLLIGPEGGLTDEETEAATGAGFVRIRLGPRVLRTETAPIAALSIIQFLIGDLNKR